MCVCVFAVCLQSLNENRGDKAAHGDEFEELEEGDEIFEEKTQVILD